VSIRIGLAFADAFVFEADFCQGFCIGDVLQGSSSTFRWIGTSRDRLSSSQITGLNLINFVSL
ncbi:MAG: hypothetical protein Q8T04_15710, partial [Bacteroidota bacterium]|nr:hypothetical protein [Bacteroidota bacterium]